MTNAMATRGEPEGSAYRDRTVLITGASGFIGSRLAGDLIQAGATVHGVARAEPFGADPGVKWWLGDLSDAAFARRLFRGARPEMVFHLASHVAGTRDLEAVLPTLQSNLVATVHVLREATDAGCHRVVLAGSMEEPEEGTEYPTPVSPYAAAKWASSGYARMFRALYGTPVAQARIFMVYGPGQRNLAKLVPYVITALLRGESPAVGSGVRPVDWIYVDDVVNGLLRLGAAEELPARPVDLGSGTHTTIREAVEEIEALLGKQGEVRFGALPDRPMEPVRLADAEATASALGWAPKVNLRSGLRATIRWYREQLNGEIAEQAGGLNGAGSSSGGDGTSGGGEPPSEGEPSE